jgi:2-oxoglutarate ferredoxin oxidoreductase subunit alpha
MAAVKRCRAEGLAVGLLRLQTLWPFADKEIEALGRDVDRIVFPEMNLGQMAGIARQHARCDVVSLSQTNGRIIEPDTICEAIRRVQ